MEWITPPEEHLYKGKRFRPPGEVIHKAHPDRQFWEEQMATIGIMEQWDEDEPEEPEAKPIPTPPASVESLPIGSRICVTRTKAAGLLGVSVDYFDDHVKPGIKMITNHGGIRLVPVRELEAWVTRNAARALKDR